MRPLVLSCSPRKGGNSDIIVSSIVDHFDVDTIYLRDLKYAMCDGCDACHSLHRCKHEDDATRLYADVMARDVIIFVAPVYFFGFDAHTKAFIDRAQYLWSLDRDRSHERHIYLIGIGGQTREDIFEPMEKTLHALAVTIGGKYEGGIFFRGVDKKGDISQGDNLENVISFVDKILV